MLFKTLGFTTSFGNIAILSALFYNDTIFNFGNVHWNIAFGSMIFLSILSTSLFWLNNQKEGVNVLKIYGGIYASFGLLIYGYWGFKNLFSHKGIEEFASLFLLFLTFSSIAFLSIRSYMNEYSGHLLLAFSSILSILTVAISFGTIYKYVFIQAPFNFDNLVLELFIIFLGSILFITTHNFAKKHQ